MSKALPIIFDTDAVLATLDGKKTATRRPIKPQPQMPLAYAFAGCGCGTWGYPGENAHRYWGEKYRLPDGLTEKDKERRWTPPCHADDILYVRETWGEWTDGYVYKAWSGPFAQPGACPCMKWASPVNMPKEAARLFLKVTDVRVERLQDMKPVDVIKEGAYLDCCDCLDTYGDSGSQCCYKTEEECSQCDSVMTEWQKLWDSTIKKSDLSIYGWDANPYVWVIEFEQCEKPKEWPTASEKITQKRRITWKF